MNLLGGPATNIPLKCTVCPKKPRFSDVSHLLTHIASKGHLSAYYKMKVQASQDKEAKQTIQNFDEWYDDFNLEDLMQERMAAKEKKRSSGSALRGNVPTAAKIEKKTSARGKPTPPGDMARRQDSRQSSRPDELDPMLGRRMGNDNVLISRSTTPAAFAFEQYNFQRAIAASNPILQNWGLGSLPSTPSLVKQESLESEYEDDGADEDADMDIDGSYYLPVADYARRSSHGTSGQNRSRTTRRKRDSNNSLPSDGTVDKSESEPKLKGVVWEGMDLFDSATSEAKRKRNQKKGAAVLQKLQETSEQIEPVEVVFKHGVQCRERTITGLPNSDDGGHLSGESDPESDVPERKARGRPRTTAPRKPLAQKQVNTGLLRNTLGRKSTHVSTFTTRGPYYNVEDDGDDALTYGQAKKRSGLSIHQDNSGPEITFEPPRINFLTAGFGSNAVQHGGPNPLATGFQQVSAVTHGHNRQASWGSFNGFRPSISANNMSVQNGNGYQAYGGYNMGPPNFPSLAFGPPLLVDDNPFGAMNGGLDLLGPFGNDIAFGSMGDNIGHGSKTDGSPGQQLFLSCVRGPVEDDEATISAMSEH